METFGKEKVQIPSQKDAMPETPSQEVIARPLPQSLRYLMLGLLILGVAGAVVFAFIRQNPARPVLNPNADTCADPVTENRLRETVSKSPNDFSSLMDWGDYNRRCLEPADLTSAISAYQNAARLADNPANKILAENRIEAHLNLGLAYLFKSSFKEAQSEFRLIVNEQPNNTSALLALGAALSKEDAQQALVYLKKVLEVAPAGSPVIQNAQALINDINKNNAGPLMPTPTPKV